MKINLYNVKDFLKTKKGKIIALGLSATLVTSCIGGCMALFNDKEKEEINTSSITDIDGVPFGPSKEYVDVNTETKGVYYKQISDKLDDASFALIDFTVEYDDRGTIVGKSNYDSLSNLASERNVEIGYLYNPTSTDRASMYLAIKELKEMMSYYDVNYPIVYNADSLHKTENEQNKEYNYSILKSFIEKMSENNCYVMVAGSEDTLIDMEKRFKSHENNNIDFKSIDKIVFSDVELKDDYCMKMVDGKITSAYNYTSFINVNGINDKGHFVKDCVHTVKPGDSLGTIADAYDFNEYNIIKYNNRYSTLYDTHELYNGQQIFIPSQITKHNKIITIRKNNYDAQEKESDLVSIKGSYIKDKEVDFNMDASISLIEFEAAFNKVGKKEYITGNLAFQKYTDAKIPFGVVVKPNGARLGDVYCAIKSLKLYMKKYDVKYPIYYNVDTIFESDNEDKYNYDLSKAFIERLQYDGCFVGFIGSQDNIRKLKKLYEDNNDLDLFNKIPVGLYLDEDEEINYDSNVGLYVKDKKEVVSKVDYEGIINNEYLNSESNFKGDYTYTTKAGDTLDTIASKYNFAKWNIQMYNPQYDFNTGKLKEGQIIYLPNVLKDTEKEVDNVPPVEIDNDGKYYIGIDVSYAQREIDWEKVAPYIDYAILRFGDAWYFKGFGGYESDDNMIDSYFKYNYSECKRLGIPVGIYVFSNFYMEEDGTNLNYEDEARREAEFAATYLKENGYVLELPFYMDYEPSAGTLYDFVTLEQLKNIINIHKEIIESNGFYYGVYSNADFYDKKIGNQGLGYESWVAYNSGKKITEDDFDSCNTTYSLSGDIVNNNQITFKGSLPGIKTDVDIDLADQELMDHCKEFYKKMGN